MASRSKNAGFSDFFTDVRSAETVRKQFIDAPMDAARETAIASAMEVARVVSALPGAFAESQRRELERLKRTRGEDDPRVLELQSSLDGADAAGRIATLGQARLKRALAAFSDREDAFHGFVSDADLHPQQGLTVRLSGIREASGKKLTATTDADGYFRIPLGVKRDAKRGEKPASSASAPRGFADFFARFSETTRPATTSGDTDSAPEERATVEILRKGQLLYTDPAPLAMTSGGAYREYTIPTTESSSTSDLNAFISGKPAAKRSRTTGDRRPRRSPAKRRR